MPASLATSNRNKNDNVADQAESVADLVGLLRPRRPVASTLFPYLGEYPGPFRFPC